MRLTPHEMAVLCREFGLSMKQVTPAGIDPVRLIWAMSGNETSFGANVVPRHEPGYCYGGGMYKLSLELRGQTAEHGCLAHMSYGPLQVMHLNVIAFTEAKFGPIGLATNPRTGMLAAIEMLKKEIFGRQGCKTLAEIGDAWNTGNAKDAIVPVKYIEDLKRNYDHPMAV